jgi:dienelactone hydrolase
LGYTFPNTRLIADQLAAAGYFTVVPDLFAGSEVPFPVPAEFNLQEWIDTSMPGIDVVDAIIEKLIAHLRSAMGVKRLGGVGYCFGGKYVCRWLREDAGKIDVGFTGHPSFVAREEVERVRGPLSIAAAGMCATSDSQVRG